MRHARRSAAGTGIVLVIAAALAASAARPAPAAQLSLGAAVADITPEKPTALDGQFQTRICHGVDNRLTATALAIESRQDGRAVDQAILVSCDLVAIRNTMLAPLRERLRHSLPDFDAGKLILTATHTHTAPVTEAGHYEIPPDVMQPAQYVDFLHGRLEQAAVAAWRGRQPGGVSWGLGYAVVGHNRRAVYADGTAKMYGSTALDSFRGLEAGDDPGLEMLFFWNPAQKPLALAINVGCPAQEVESRYTVNADFWHDVRRQLRAELAADLPVLGWPAACGDLSPHRMYRKAAEERMLKLRGLTATQELGRRIAREAGDVFQLARREIHSDVPFAHKVADLVLPRRKVTAQEAAKARAEIETLVKKGDTSRRRRWFQATIDRYRKQDQDPGYPVELHVLRIGDVAIATNPFELFVDYGVQIKGRSKALQTLLLQLTNGPGTYLATAKAVGGGGYSAVVESNQVGPEGGQILVERTVQLINSMFPEPGHVQ